MTLHLKSNMLVLALCALVSMVALQTWEVSHDHAHTGAAVECQVSSPADTVLPVPSTVAPALATLPEGPTQSRLEGHTRSLAIFSSRGPPAIS